MKVSRGNSKKILSVFLISFFLLATSEVVSADDVIIICNKSVKAQSLNQDDVRSIFLGRKTTWDDGSKISFTTMKEGEAHESFVETYVGKTGFQFDTYWKKLVFTGRAMSPKAFTEAAEIMNYVASTDGSIGYIPASALNEGIQVIRFTRADEDTLVPVMVSMALHTVME